MVVPDFNPFKPINFRSNPIKIGQLRQKFEHEKSPENVDFPGFVSIFVREIISWRTAEHDVRL